MGAAVWAQVQGEEKTSAKRLRVLVSALQPGVSATAWPHLSGAPRAVGRRTERGTGNMTQLEANGIWKGQSSYDQTLHSCT